MDAVLQKLLSEKVLTEDTAKAIKEAYQASLNEAKAEQEADIRADLMAQYEKDKAAMTEALEQFLQQELSEHVAGLRDGVAELDKLKLEYAQKTSKIGEAARNYVRDRMSILEQALDKIIKRELSEVHESEVENRRAYLRAIQERTAELEQEKVKFREKAAAVLEDIINVKVTSTLEELREDIQAAREADFGREIFESFFTTFRRQFFNSDEEFRAMATKLKESEERRERVEKAAKAKIVEARKEAEIAVAQRQKVEESVARKAKITRMLGGLSGQPRSQMKSLLEATATKDLDRAFKKNLPIVMKEAKRTPASKQSKLTEAVAELKTGGNRSIVLSEGDDSVDQDIVDIRRRAAL